MRQVLLGALAGTVPGLVLLLLAFVVTGEESLTFGAFGMMLIPVGAVLGAIAVLRLRKR